MAEEQVEQQAAPEVSPEEEKAMSMGWRPKEEFNGDPDIWVDAGEFIRRDPLIQKIERYGKKIGDLENNLKQFADHHAKVKEHEFQHAMTELKKQYREAMKEHDTEQALEYSDKMEELHTKYQEVQREMPQVQNQPSTDFQEWVAKNDWYNNDQDMHDFADNVAMGYVQKKGGNVPHSEVLKYVDKVVQKQYPEKFDNPNRNRPGTTTRGDTNTGRPASRSNFKLTPEQEQVARKWDKMGVISYDKYVAEIKKMEAE